MGAMVWGEVPRDSPENLEQSTEKDLSRKVPRVGVQVGENGAPFFLLSSPIYCHSLEGSLLFGGAEANLRLKFRKMGRTPWDLLDCSSK